MLNNGRNIGGVIGGGRDATIQLTEHSERNDCLIGDFVALMLTELDKNEAI